MKQIKNVKIVKDAMDKKQIIARIKAATDSRDTLEGMNQLNSMSRQAYDLLTREGDMESALGAVGYASYCARNLEADDAWLRGLEPWIRDRVLGICATIISRRDAVDFLVMDYHLTFERTQQ